MATPKQVAMLKARASYGGIPMMRLAELLGVTEDGLDAHLNDLDNAGVDHVLEVMKPIIDFNAEARFYRRERVRMQQRRDGDFEYIQKEGWGS